MAAQPVQPSFVTRITTRDGDVIYERKGERARPGRDPTADLGAMNLMLRAVVT